jgi:exopolysaccharide production protein ExoZ
MEGRTKLQEIQILRAVAALAVVVVHVGIELRYWGKATIGWTDVGSAGVDLFFVISGFIMIYIAWDRFGTRGAPLDFFTRRLIRIVPLYWLVTTGYVLINTYPASRIITSYLFVPDLTANAANLPVILQGWTLNFEMLFYAVLAVALFLPRLAAMGCVSALMVAIVLLGLPFYGSTIILEFVLGMWIGFAYRRKLRVPAPARLMAIVVGAVAIGATIFLPAQDRFVSLGIPAALIVAGATLGTPINDSRLVRALVLLGDASYALYLTHPLMTRLSATIMRDVIGLNSFGQHALYFVVAFAFAIGLALLIYIFVERPITTTLQRLWMRRDVSIAPAPKLSGG